MKFILLFSFLTVPLFVFSQLKVDFKNPGQFYNNIIKEGTSKLLTSDELINMKAEELPASFTDTLKKYYWIELCSYHYSQKKYSTKFTDAIQQWHVQIDYREFDKDGILVQYQISRSAKDTTIYTTTFDKKTASKIVAIKNISGANYIILEAHGEKENHKLISYNNGILIQEISMNGRVGEKASFRNAYLAIPKP